MAFGVVKAPFVELEMYDYQLTCFLLVIGFGCITWGMDDPL